MSPGTDDSDAVTAADAPEDVVARVFVVGTFGTEAVAETLASVLRRRGRETHAVTTGDGTETWRGDARAAAVQVVAVGGDDSATPIRDALDLIGPPDVVAVTAIGLGELASYGPGRGDVVRTIAAAVPAGVHVVSAEGSPGVAGYLETAVERRGATIDHVGAHDAAAPGAEFAGAVDGVLAALDEPPLPEEERGSLVAASRPEWVDLPDGRLYDALGVTDTVAVERLRRALVGTSDRSDGGSGRGRNGTGVHGGRHGGIEGNRGPTGRQDAATTPVELLAVLDEQRRDAAAALAAYAERAHGRDAVATLHVLGPLADRVAARCDASTVAHGPGTDPGDVLDAALSGGPTLVVGSEDCEDGDALADALARRVERSGSLRIG